MASLLTQAFWLSPGTFSRFTCKQVARALAAESVEARGEARPGVLTGTL